MKKAILYSLSGVLLMIMTSCYRNSQSALIQAIQANDLSKVQRIIDQSSNNEKLLNTHKNGRSILHIAVLNCNLEIVQLLIDSGTKHYQSTTKQWYFMLGAVECKNLNLVDLLVNTGADPGFSGVLIACLGGNFELFEYYMKYGIDVNKPIEQSTILRAAVYGRNLEIVTSVLELGADVNQFDKFDGDYPIHAAVGTDFGEDMIPIIQLLLDYGADPYRVDRNGLNAFQSAKKFNGEASLKVMQDYLETE